MSVIFAVEFVVSVLLSKLSENASFTGSVGMVGFGHCCFPPMKPLAVTS
jgi:hypothetical protein